MHKKPLDRNVLKYIVCGLMLLDHMTLVFPMGSEAKVLIVFLSRLTAPVMAYFVAEGYAHTKDLRKYMGRLALFAVLSALPFTYLSTGHLLPVALTDSGMGETMGFYIPRLGKFLVFRGTGVLFTLFLGLVNIWVWDRWKAPVPVKALVTLGSIWLAAFGDWFYWNILFCLTFYFLRNNRRVMWTVYGLICLTVVWFVRLFYNPFIPRLLYIKDLSMALTSVNWGTLLVIPFIEALYSGEKGSGKPVHKWFFYIFYPAHLALLGILKFFL